MCVAMDFTYWTEVATHNVLQTTQSLKIDSAKTVVRSVLNVKALLIIVLHAQSSTLSIVTHVFYNVHLPTTRMLSPMNVKVVFPPKLSSSLSSSLPLSSPSLPSSPSASVNQQHSSPP